MIMWAPIQPASSTTPDASRGSSRAKRERPSTARIDTQQGYAVATSTLRIVASDDVDADAGVGPEFDAEPGRRQRPLRIIVAKPGLDGHDRGAKVVARALRDAGMEVIYTGLHQTPEQIVRTALAEDADAIGLSVLSGAHMTLFARVVELLRAADAEDIVLFGGGIIPEADRLPLAELGVAAVFTPGSTMAEVVNWVRGNVGPEAAGRRGS
jgi:methylmalonyl-CoA mutase C-terminal domain/subunit